MGMKLSQSSPALAQGAVLDQKANNTAAGTVMVPLYETIQIPSLGATSASLTAFVCDNTTSTQTYQVVGVSVVFGTTSSSGTLQVEVASGTTAVGSGTNQLTGTVSLSGTANTPVNGAIITTPTTVSPGSRVNIILAGTLTGLANCCVNIVLQRIA